MSPARTVLAAIALTALFACESLLEPEVGADASSLGVSSDKPDPSRSARTSG